MAGIYGVSAGVVHNHMTDRVDWDAMRTIGRRLIKVEASAVFVGQRTGSVVGWVVPSSGV